MKHRAKKDRLTADNIAEKAMAGEDISAFFTNKGVMKPAIQRVNVDFPAWIVSSLDLQSREIGVSRQALIKLWISERLKEELRFRQSS